MFFTSYCFGDLFFSINCSLTIVPSKFASRILTTFGCRHSVKMLISVKRHSRHSLLFTICLVLMILTATFLLVFISMASLTLYRNIICQNEEITKFKAFEIKLLIRFSDNAHLDSTYFAYRPSPIVLRIRYLSSSTFRIFPELFETYPCNEAIFY